MSNPAQYPYHFFYSEAERLLLASHLLNFGVWEFDFANNQLVWDDKMFDIYGVQKKDFQNHIEDFRTRVHPQDISKVDSAMQDIVDSISPLFAQFRIVRPSGEIRIIAGNVKCIRNANSKPIRLIGINHDITEKQVLQEKLQRRNSQLKKIAWMQSHKIRKPVANIIGLIHLYELKADELSEPQILSYLKVSATELDKMIQAIINRSKSEE